jgi:hypothetical protein
MSGLVMAANSGGFFMSVSRWGIGGFTISITTGFEFRAEYESRLVRRRADGKGRRRLYHRPDLVL